MKGEFTAIYEKRQDWYVGYVAEIAGVNTQGKTLDEVRSNLKEALRLVLECNRELAERSAGHPGTDQIRESIAIELGA